MKNLAGIDTDHDFWIDKILTRTGAQPTGKGTNDKGAYSYEAPTATTTMFTRGRAAYMYTHTPNQLGFVGDTAYWDQTSRSGFTVTVNADGSNQTLNEDASQRKQTPELLTSLFQTGGKSLKIKEVQVHHLQQRDGCEPHRGKHAGPRCHTDHGLAVRRRGC